MNIDWKFIITTIVAVAGIAVSVWLWRADVGSSSLSAQILPPVALQPKLASSVQDLRVTVAGKEIESPSLSVISIKNDGSRPIPTSSFESPIRLSLSDGASVVRAGIESVEPASLNVHLQSTEKDVSISPLLLNPGDTISLSIITSGVEPRFTASSRVAGVSEISIDRGDGKESAYVKIAFLVLAAIFSYMVSLTFIEAVTGKATIAVGRGVAAFFALFSAMLGGGSILAVSERLASLGSSFGYWSVYAAIFCAALVLNLLFVRVKKVSET